MLLKETFSSSSIERRTTHYFVFFVNLDFSYLDLPDCELSYKGQGIGLPEVLLGVSFPVTPHTWT